MASERQLAANRRNGAKGGPKTEAGKQRSRLGSLKHGLCASTVIVLPEENEHEYEEVLRGFRDSFNPADPAEDALVLRLAQAHWRGLRSRRVETGILSITATFQRNQAREIVPDCPKQINPHEAIAVAFMTMPAEHWQMYMRYDTAISREFFKTLEALTKLQRARQRHSRSRFPTRERLPDRHCSSHHGRRTRTPTVRFRDWVRFAESLSIAGSPRNIGPNTTFGHSRYRTNCDFSDNNRYHESARTPRYCCARPVCARRFPTRP